MNDIEKRLLQSASQPQRELKTDFTATVMQGIETLNNTAKRQSKWPGLRLKSHRPIFASVAIGGVLLVFTAIYAPVFPQHKRTDAAPSVRPGIGAAVKSKFSSAGIAGWWQGATNETSMALFQSGHRCFVSGEYKTGSVDVATELQKAQTLLANQGYTISPDNTQTVTIQTISGPQQYDLYQSSVATPAGAETVEGGQEFGYIQFSNGYVKIEGYCDTASELPSTIPGLQSIKFNENG